MAKFIGAHVDSKGGVESAPVNAREIGATAFGFFLKVQRDWYFTKLTEEKIALFKQLCKIYNYTNKQILAHGSYLTNLGCPDELQLKKCREAFFEEMRRCELLGLDKLNMHPGNSINRISPDLCKRIIAESINMALDRTNDVTVVLENTSGWGGVIGAKFEELAYIIDRIEDKSRVGICLDVCHLFAAGYDIRTPEGYKKTLQEFDDIVGFKYVKGLNISDNKKWLGSHYDIHECLGEGYIDMDIFRWFIRDKRFNNMPIILETPEEDYHVEEIQILKSFCR